MKPNPKKQREAYRIIKKIIKILENPPEDFPEIILKKKLKHCYGYYDVDTITLEIFSSIVPTLCHEILHYCYDEWNETRIIKTEKLIKHYIRIKDIIKILRLFLNHVENSENYKSKH